MLPGDNDLDLYLLDSKGNLVAQSTNGGTDETIDLVRPADDTYTLVVHGWQVPNPPLAYTLWSWEVPADSGGSLVVDNAPTERHGVVSNGHRVDQLVGLDPDQSYLGAVSHDDSEGRIGLTLVSVAT